MDALIRSSPDGDKDVANPGLLEIAVGRLRNAIVRRCQRALGHVSFWLRRPGVWPVVLKVRVFRLLVWLGDPLADWWWRVSGLQAAHWRAVRRIKTPIIDPDGSSGG